MSIPTNKIIIENTPCMSKENPGYITGNEPKTKPKIQK